MLQQLAGRAELAVQVLVVLLVVRAGRRPQQLAQERRQQAVVVLPVEELYLLEPQNLKLYREIEHHSLSSSVMFSTIVMLVTLKDFGDRVIVTNNNCL